MATGDIDQAITELAAAADALDRFRAALADDELRLLAFQSHQAYDDDAGFASVVASLAKVGRVDLALEFAEGRRARVLAERLGAGNALTGTRLDRINRLRAQLPDSSALLFVHGGRRAQPSTLFLVRRQGTTAVDAPGMELLEELTRNFTAILRGGTAAAAPGHRLRQLILDPLLPLIDPGVTRLVIVPDGELNRLPFEALPLPDGEPLVSRFALSLAPSATVAAELWSRARETGVPRALALGDPVFPPLDDIATDDSATLYRQTFRDAGGLPRLRASADEARLLARFAPGAEVRLREAASESWLERAPLEQYRLIHIASHAVVSEQSVGRTSLALAPGGGEDGFLGVADLAGLQLHADLVVLSACRTAGGVIVGGEGIQGLVAPLLAAGARSVLATRWQIGDAAAARFTDRFYRAMASGQRASEALRSAKLASLSAGASPDEWAAFVLVGDGEVRLSLRPPRRTPVPYLLAILALGSLVGYGVMRNRRGVDSSVVPS
jgi:CHAT domain-containing protein